MKSLIDWLIIFVRYFKSYQYFSWPTCLPYLVYYLLLKQKSLICLLITRVTYEIKISSVQLSTLPDRTHLRLFSINWPPFLPTCWTLCPHGICPQHRDSLPACWTDIESDRMMLRLSVGVRFFRRDREIARRSREGRNGARTSNGRRRSCRNAALVRLPFALNLCNDKR